MPHVTGLALLDVALLALVAGFSWSLGAWALGRLVSR